MTNGTESSHFAAQAAPPSSRQEKGWRPRCSRRPTTIP
ncbi:MAG: hypothetical protein BWX64_01434 [Acidobacteria bacterium ADurb.Bin051]|nr:MAG: hypothetical protein BWX64_01434 [Acidobacteria bacterium ADurb.Bin051]